MFILNSFSVLFLPFGDTTIPVQTGVPQMTTVASLYLPQKFKRCSLLNIHKCRNGYIVTLCSAPKFYFGREIKQAFANTCTFRVAILIAARLYYKLGDSALTVWACYRYHKTLFTLVYWQRFQSRFRKLIESIYFGCLNKMQEQ